MNGDVVATLMLVSFMAGMFASDAIGIGNSIQAHIAALVVLVVAIGVKEFY